MNKLSISLPILGPGSAHEISPKDFRGLQTSPFLEVALSTKDTYRIVIPNIGKRTLCIRIHTNIYTYGGHAEVNRVKF